MNEKVTIYGVRQAYLGLTIPITHYFSNKQARDKYVLNHDNLDVLKPITILKKNVNKYTDVLFDSYNQFKVYYGKYL